MNVLRPAALLALIAAAVWAVPQEERPGLTPEQRADAQRVLELIEHVRAASGASSADPRTAVVTERELNGYIAHRIASEEEDVLRDLRLKLFDGNRVEGLAVIDLRGRNLPSFIKPMMNVVFAGVVEARPGMARVRFESLYLEQQRIQTALLDMVLAAVSELEGTEPLKLEDWYALPYGIKALEIRPGRLVATY
jgi:hypothetical protein